MGPTTAHFKPHQSQIRTVHLVRRSHTLCDCDASFFNLGYVVVSAVLRGKPQKTEPSFIPATTRQNAVPLSGGFWWRHEVPEDGGLDELDYGCQSEQMVWICLQRTGEVQDHKQGSAFGFWCRKWKQQLLLRSSRWYSSSTHIGIYFRKNANELGVNLWKRRGSILRMSCPISARNPTEHSILWSQHVDVAGMVRILFFFFFSPGYLSLPAASDDETLLWLLLN